LIVPNADYRPNPARAIHVVGLIDDAQVSRLTPQILRLQSESRDPITVYILDSPGGVVNSMETILRLLNSSNQDFEGACQIITVVTTRAASAAADLLSSGDYAIAYPKSTILYHGIRTPLREATAETTSLMANILRLSNDYYAMELAGKIELRFMFRFASLRGEINKFRDKVAPKIVSDLDCFLEIISGKLSHKARKAFDRALERYKRYESLLNHVTKKTKRFEGKTLRPSQLEAARIKAIVDFEVASNRSDSTWSFKADNGLGRIADDFFLLNEYLDTHATDRLLEWCSRYSKFAISPAESAEIEQIADEQARNLKMIEKVQPLLQPVWSFFIALCHALQEGENELTANDAYWLGLVDEVMGRPNLSALRLLGEHVPDPEQPEQLELQPPAPEPAAPQPNEGPKPNVDANSSGPNHINV
jgi:ATP-dependent protease ClpP protease subunit